MSNTLPERFFEELTTKLNAAGLPNHQVHSFVEQYCEYQAYDSSSFELFENHQMPSDDCFRTLAEAQKIFASNTDRTEYTTELTAPIRYLEIPYCNVSAAKTTMMECFGCNESDVEVAYCQDPEWLFITEDAVNAIADFLKTRFFDRVLIWSIYKKAALLGVEKIQYRINTVMEMLGTEIGEKVIRNDLRGDAWLFYQWFTDPVGCIEYMLECGLTPAKILVLLENEPHFLFEYKEGRKLKYHHNQEYIDCVISKYRN